MAITYRHDVLPLFRAMDIGCMTVHRVYLADADWMCDPTGDHANARQVFAVLSEGSMPPDAPWIPAKLATFSDWMTGGFLP